VKVSGIKEIEVVTLILKRLLEEMEEIDIPVGSRLRILNPNVNLKQEEDLREVPKQSLHLVDVRKLQIKLKLMYSSLLEKISEDTREDGAVIKAAKPIGQISMVMDLMIFFVMIQEVTIGQCYQMVMAHSKT